MLQPCSGWEFSIYYWVDNLEGCVPIFFMWPQPTKPAPKSFLATKKTLSPENSEEEKRNTKPKIKKLINESPFPSNVSAMESFLCWKLLGQSPEQPVRPWKLQASPQSSSELNRLISAPCFFGYGPSFFFWNWNRSWSVFQKCQNWS